MVEGTGRESPAPGGGPSGVPESGSGSAGTPGKPTTVLVSGENLRKGGGQTVLRSTLSELVAAPGLTCTALVPTGFVEECPPEVREGVTLIERPRWSPALVRRLAARADVLMSMGNWAVPGVGIPQIVLCHWPYALYDDAALWEGMTWRDRALRKVKRSVFRAMIPAADVVLLQTEVARRRFEARYPGLRTDLLPNVVPSRLLHEARRAASRPAASTAGARVLILARYYPHKNFDVLLPLARRIRDAGLDWSLITTLDPAEGPGAREFLRRVEDEGLAKVIDNVGPIPADGLRAAYVESSAVLLPSLLESFSGVYLEAMAFGVPVVTSDRDFARAVCGDAAVYVDPLDADAIFDGLGSVLGSSDLRASLVERGRARLAGFPTATEVGARLVRILTVGAHPSPHRD